VKNEKNKNKINLLLLGRSNGRKIGPMAQENVGTKNDMCRIFKKSDPHAKVLEDIGKIHKGLTKEDHIIIVGGPGKSWTETIIIKLKMISTSLQRRHQNPVCDLSTSLRAATR
jgi:hypothetical protein